MFDELTSTVPRGLRPGAAGIARRGARGVRSDPLLWAGTFGVAVFVLAAILANLIMPHDPLATDVSQRLTGPHAGHLAGTDEFGRDILSRTILASRVSLEVAVVAVGIGLLIGLPIGTAAAYVGGWLDALLMRFIDLLFSFPAILLAIVIMATLGTSIVNAMIAIGIIFAPGFARVARSLIQVTQREKFVDYARCIGTSPLRVIVREIFPNIWPTILAQASIAMGYAVTVEAALSFLGLGAQPPTPSWGNMINEGYGYLTEAPWMVIAPGIALFLAIVSLNVLGDGLRDRFDPRIRMQRG